MICFVCKGTVKDGFTTFTVIFSTIRSTSSMTKPLCV